ncbi:hypothetical protein BDR07DRAFT_1379813 [Suillus spraguei]|nr:hypothetical protein BDR07DRAFT_1379813 [Suillus spraguei]
MPPVPKELEEVDTSTLQGIMIVYPKWRLVLGYLQLLIRVAILKGESENPHIITRALVTRKTAFIEALFAESLVHANTTVRELEKVISTQDGQNISQQGVLNMASHAARLEILLNHFLPPHSTHLPIDQNGTVWFLRTKLAKSLLWHVVFRVTRSNGIRVNSTPAVPLIVADLAPDAFKNGPNLPFDTLAFVESFCYTVLVRLLKGVMQQLPNATLCRAYPNPRKVHNCSVEMISMLLQQHNNPGLAPFQAHMFQLCDLDYGGRWQSNFKKLQECFNMLKIRLIPTCHPTFVTLSKDQLFGIGHDKNALASWLQKYGPEILSYSLLIMASVLFGLVNSHDITGLLEVVLEEVKMQIPLQQEEENCSAFLQRGGRCFMEQRMYCTQTEVSLFSKAIVNLCEELNTRNQPASWCFDPNLTLLTVNAVGYVGPYPPPSSLSFKCFGPTKAMQKATHDKCHAWLLASSQSQDMQVASNASTHFDSPRLQESLLRIHDKQRFIQKEYKSPDALMSIFHILDLKMQCAQAEADMFFEAIECTAEIKFTDDAIYPPKSKLGCHNFYYCIGAADVDPVVGGDLKSK